MIALLVALALSGAVSASAISSPLTRRLSSNLSASKPTGYLMTSIFGSEDCAGSPSSVTAIGFNYCMVTFDTNGNPKSSAMYTDVSVSDANISYAYQLYATTTCEGTPTYSSRTTATFACQYSWDHTLHITYSYADAVSEPWKQFANNVIAQYWHGDNSCSDIPDTWTATSNACTKIGGDPKVHSEITTCSKDLVVLQSFSDSACSASLGNTTYPTNKCASSSASHPPNYEFKSFLCVV